MEAADQRTGIRELRGAAGALFLECEGAASSLDGAAELRQHGVTAGAEDPAFVPGDQCADGLVPRAEGFQRDFLVRAHEARIALHVVAGEDGGQLASNPLLCRGSIFFRDTRNGSLYGSSLRASTEAPCPTGHEASRALTTGVS